MVSKRHSVHTLMVPKRDSTIHNDLDSWHLADIMVRVTDNIDWQVDIKWNSSCIEWSKIYQNAGQSITDQQNQFTNIFF